MPYSLLERCGYPLLIDHGSRHMRHRDVRADIMDTLRYLRPLGRRKLLGVVQAMNKRLRWKNARANRERPGQSPPTDLVHACYTEPLGKLESTLHGIQGVQTLAFPRTLALLTLLTLLALRAHLALPSSLFP